MGINPASMIPTSIRQPTTASHSMYAPQPQYGYGANGTSPAPMAGAAAPRAAGSWGGGQAMTSMTPGWNNLTPQQKTAANQQSIAGNSGLQVGYWTSGQPTGQPLAPGQTGGQFNAPQQNYGGQSYGGGQGVQNGQSYSGGQGAANPLAAGGGALNFGSVPNDYSSAYANALSLNSQNYSNILSGYQNLLSQQKQDQAGVQSRYDSLWPQVQQTIKGIDESQRQALSDTYAWDSGKIKQQMISSGLGNTTAATSAQSMASLNNQKANVALSNQMAQLNAGYQSQLGMAGAGYAGQANAQNAQLGQNQLNWMNSVNAPYPNLKDWQNTAQMQGAVAGYQPATGYNPAQAPGYPPVVGPQGVNQRQQPQQQARQGGGGGRPPARPPQGGNGGGGAYGPNGWVEQGRNDWVDPPVVGQNDWAGALPPPAWNVSDQGNTAPGSYTYGTGWDGGSSAPISTESSVGNSNGYNLENAYGYDPNSWYAVDSGYNPFDPFYSGIW